jgi:hypothetical protein
MMSPSEMRGLSSCPVFTLIAPDTIETRAASFEFLESAAFSEVHETPQVEAKIHPIGSANDRV